MGRQSGQRLNQWNMPGIGLLVYSTLVVMLLTLMPLRFTWPPEWKWLALTNVSDLVLNVFLFLPIGFLFRIAYRSSLFKGVLAATIYGACLTSFIEVTQTIVIGRIPTIPDLVTNAMGAAIGAVVYSLFKSRLAHHPLARVVAIEYPLMFDVYLLTFLIWLNSSNWGNEASRLTLLPILMIFGARIFGSVVAYQSIHKSTARAAFDSIIMVGIWAVVTSAPALVQHREFVGIVIGVTMILTIIQLFWLRSLDIGQRRFEVDTLKPLIYLLVLYLIALIGWPLGFDGGVWSLHIEWTYIGYAKRGMQFYFVQLFVAFTLTGFMLAELYGRRYEGIPISKYLSWAASMLVAIVVIEGFHVQHHLALVELLVIFLGYFCGLALYHQQRQTIRRSALPGGYA